MVTISLTYTGELHCEATHGPSGTRLSTDAPKDNQGKGESFSPTDLLATALGSCILTVMGIAARRIGAVIDGATVEVEKVMVATPTRRIGTLTCHIVMPAGIDVGHHPALISAAERCPVKESLHPDTVVTLNWQWR